MSNPFPVRYMKQPNAVPTVVPDLDAVHAHGCWGCGLTTGVWYEGALCCCIEHMPWDVVSRTRLIEAVERKRKSEAR